MILKGSLNSLNFLMGSLNCFRDCRLSNLKNVSCYCFMTYFKEILILNLNFEFGSLIKIESLNFNNYAFFKKMKIQKLLKIKIFILYSI